MLSTAKWRKFIGTSRFFSSFFLNPTDHSADNDVEQRQKYQQSLNVYHDVYYHSSEEQLCVIIHRIVEECDGIDNSEVCEKKCINDVVLSLLVRLTDGMNRKCQDNQQLNGRIKLEDCPRVSIGCKNDGSIEEIESGKESVPVLERALECIKNLDGH